MTVNLAGIVVAVVSAAVGGVAVAAAPSLGISEANAIPFGLLVAGILACLISWHQSVSGNPNSIIFPMWMYGTAAAIVGVLGLIGVLSLTGSPALSREELRRLDEISEKLRRLPASGSSRKGGELAQRFQGALAPTVRKLGGGDRTSVYVDVGAEGERARAASMFVRVEAGERLKEEDRKQLLSLCIKLLQTELPQLPCNAALQGPDGWLGTARSAGPNLPSVPVIGPDPPEF